MKTESTSAAAAFESLGVCSQLAEAAAALGWKQPTAVQEQAVPLLLQGLFALAPPPPPAACKPPEPALQARATQVPSPADRLS